MRAHGRGAGTTTPDEGQIGRLTSDEGLAAICRLMSSSRSAAHAMDLAAFSGFRLVHGSTSPSDTLAVGVPRVLSVEAKVAYVARALRRIQQDACGVTAAVHGLPSQDSLAGRMLAEADARSYVVHVAAQLAMAGSPGPWAHVASAPATARAADHYVRGFRKGGERVGATMAMSCHADDESFADSMAADPTRSAPSVAGSMRALALLMAPASPAGEPYPGKALGHAVASFAASAVAASARASAVAMADDDTDTVEPAMRPAA